MLTDGVGIFPQVRLSGIRQRPQIACGQSIPETEGFCTSATEISGNLCCHYGFKRGEANEGSDNDGRHCDAPGKLNHIRETQKPGATLLKSTQIHHENITLDE
jgi:hypothetical protein